MDLITWVKGLIAAGYAGDLSGPNHWQSFGEKSNQNSNEIGQDIGLPLGTAIPGVQGVVTAINYWGGAGDFAVTIKDALGNLITVGHIIPSVFIGQAIQNGETIGKSNGAPSSISSGPHIEFQIRPNGGPNVDPLGWLREQAGKLGIGQPAPYPNPGPGIPGSSEPAIATSSGPGAANNAQTAQEQSTYAATQGASTPGLPPIVIQTPFGPVNIPNPLGGLAKIFWVAAGIVIIIVGLWLMVEGSRK